MATLEQQLFSQNHWVDLDGVQTIWNFTFEGGYIDPSHVKAYYIEADERIDLTVVPADLIGEYQLEIVPAVPATASRLVIYRDTPKATPLVNFQDGAQMKEKNFDDAFRQAQFGIVESFDVGTVIVNQLTSITGGEAVNLTDLGYKNMRQNPYTGSSTVQPIDAGRTHLKLDGTSVLVPNGLPLGFLTTVTNWSDDELDLTFQGTAYVQGTSQDGNAFTVAPRSQVTINHIILNEFSLAGNVT